MGFLLRVNFITKVVDVAGKHPGQAVNTVHSWVEEKALWPTPAHVSSATEAAGGVVVHEGPSFTHASYMINPLCPGPSNHLPG